MTIRSCFWNMYLLLAINTIAINQTWAQQPQLSSKRIQDCVSRVCDAIVMVKIREQNRTATTGVIVDRTGLVLTHGHHDQTAGTSLDIVLSDGTMHAAKLLTVLDTYGGPDFSLVKIEEERDWPFARVADQIPKAGQPCLHFGYPGPSQRDTEVSSALLRIGQILATTDTSIVADPPVYMGDSGGPLFDLNAQVIGLANSYSGTGSSRWVSPGILKLNRSELFGPLATSREHVLRLREQIDRNRKLHRGLPTVVEERTLSHVSNGIVRITSGSRKAGLGTVVRGDRLIACKRSLAVRSDGKPCGDLFVSLPNGARVSCCIEKEFPEHDLLILRADQNIPCDLDFSTKPELRAGALVTSPIGGTNEARGVMSADGTFSVPPMEGYVGAFNVVPADRGVKIAVDEGLRKEMKHPLTWYSFSDGKLRHGMTVLSVNEVAVKSASAFATATSKLTAGDLLALKVINNNGKEEVVMVTAGPSYWKALDNWGPLSLRRTGLETVFAHDSPVPNRDIGGPVLLDDGTIAGINIARFHNYQTLALPTSLLTRLIEMIPNAQE